MGETIPMALLAGGTIMSAYGKKEEGEQRQQQANFAAATSKYNAKIARENKAIIDAETRFQLDVVQEEANRIISENRAAAGASGLITESKSNLWIEDEVRRRAEVDAAIVRWNGDVGKWNQEVMARGYESQASMQQHAGRQYQSAGYLSAGMTMLEGGMQVAKRYIPVSMGDDSPYTKSTLLKVKG